ncbi:MAG TPA: glycosyltransferase 87 family protein, partial [Thermoleophilaceae bacterium]
MSAFLAYGSRLGIDYLSPPCQGYVCDDAGPSIDALASGDVHDFFSEQPPMGSVSLLVRAPAAAAAKALGGHDLAVYRAGAFMCLLGVGLLAVWLMAAMARAGRPRLAYLVVPAGLLVNPLTYAALDFGHPEELLGAALAAGAVITAGRGRGVPAGLMLGCAIATKQWAALAILPAELAAPRGSRVRRLSA